MTRQTSRSDSNGLATSNGHFSVALAAVMQFTETTPMQLSVLTGRSPAAVSQWLHKGDIPSLDIIVTIEDGLGLRRGLLIGYVDPDFSPAGEPTPEQMFREALLMMKLSDSERTALLQAVEALYKLRESTGIELPPALPAR